MQLISKYFCQNWHVFKKKSMKLLGKQSTQTWITHFSKECTGRYRQYSSISRLLILIESQHLCYCIAKAILKELSSLNTPKRLQTWKKSYKNPITSVGCNGCCQMLLPVQSPSSALGTTTMEELRSWGCSYTLKSEYTEKSVHFQTNFM